MFKHHDLTLTQLNKTFEQRIKPLAFRETAPATLEAWAVRGEPVPYEQAAKANYQPLSVGDAWGSLWDTTWFRITGKVPAAFKGKEVVIRFNLGGVSGEGFTCEGLIWRDGQPAGAINVNRADIPVAKKAKAGEPFNVLVEAAANLTPGGHHVPVARMLMPDYHGKPIYQIQQCELAVWDREAWQLQHDIHVLLDALNVIARDTPRWGQILFGLNAAMSLLDERDPASFTRMRRRLKPLLTKTNGGTPHQISAIGHAHIDTAWLWPLRECIRKCARTFSTALRYLDEYPDYVFGCSQAAQYSWIKKYYPTIWRDIQKAVKKGQWEPIGSMWVETDCNIPSGESLVRQILHGKRFFRREFGVETTDVWIPDVFGYAASFPQIMAKAGVDSFLTQKISWSQFNKFPHHTFLWRGIDGTEIFTHFPPVDTYNAVLGPEHIHRSMSRFKDNDRATRTLIPYGHGDGGGGPTRTMLELGRRAADFEGLPQVTFEKVSTFFEKAKADAVDLPVWVGELYLELHRGTYTTQARTKRGNRRCEWLLHDAEMLDALDFVLFPDAREGETITSRAPGRTVYDTWDDHEDPERRRGHAGALDRAWKLVLLNQFHDIIPGSSIHWVYQDNLHDYATAATLGEQVRDDSLASLVGAVDAGEAKRPVLAINTTSFRRSEVVELADGSLVHAEVPPMGYAVIDAAERGKLPAGVTPVKVSKTKTRTVIDNGLLRIALDKSGLIASIKDHRAADREVVAPGQRANLLQLHKDYPHNWDAWELDVNYLDAFENLTALKSLKVVEQSPLRAVVEITRAFGESSLSQRLIVTAGSPRIDFDTTIDWRERHRMLKVAFPVDVLAPQATFEIQYGHLQRATHANTSWDMAQFEVCAQKWVDLSEPGYGVALLNDCKYGHDVKDNVLRLSLLRSPTNPDPEADQGEHRFTYALLPHPGDLREAGVIEQAYALNVPLVLRDIHAPTSGGGASACESWLSFDRPGVVIEAVKMSEDGDALIVRFYEAHGSRGPATLHVNLPVKSAMLADLLERDVQAAPLKNGRMRFDLKPFEIVTVKFAVK